MNTTHRAAWFCPSCQRYHAPHCDTCSGNRAPAVDIGRYFGRPEFPPGFHYGIGACGCASPKCQAEGCQSRRQGPQYGAIGSGGLQS